MIQGIKYPQNLRALRVIDEEMLRSIIVSNVDIVTMDQLIQFLDEQYRISKSMKLWVDYLIKPVSIICAFHRAAREQYSALHHLAGSHISLQLEDTTIHVMEHSTLIT